MCPLNPPTSRRVAPDGARRWPGCWPRARGATPTNWGQSPSGCWKPRPTRASRSGRSTPRSTSCRSRRCRVSGPTCVAAMRLRDVKSGWKVAEAIPAGRVAGVAAEEVNAAVLAGLAEGVSALLIRVGESGVAPAAAGEGARGRLSEHGTGDSRCRRRLPRGVDVLLELVAHVEPDQRATLSIDLGADPLTASLSDRPRRRSQEVVGRRQAGGRRPRVCGRSPSTGPRSTIWAPTRRGRSPGSIAAAVAYLRVLTESGLPVANALSQISFRLAADDDQFMTIAKIRALRQLWARVAEVVGEPERGAAVVHAETSLPMMTQRDPWVNMLRTTLAAFGAGVGGADTVLVYPFDVAIAGGFPGMATSFARRMARNIQLLLLEESHVGRILDPGGRVVVRRGPDRTAGAAGLGAFPGHRATRRVRRGARLHRRPDRRDRRPARRRRRASPYRHHRRQRIPQSGRTGSAAE